MDNKDKKEFCMSHIKELQERLAEIYTVNEIEDSKDRRTERKINLRDEVSKLEFYESIYSILEKEGDSQGDTYQEYNQYLNKVRKSLESYKGIKDDIEKSHNHEINNINLLLKTFNKTIDSIEG